jgi:hypothetical protein
MSDFGDWHWLVEGTIIIIIIIDNDLASLSRNLINSANRHPIKLINGSLDSA